MKVIILAGGKGTRIPEYSSKIPKPMVKINGIPILVHIMNHYSAYGFKDFIIALGYKGKVIKDYFKKNKFLWNIKLVNTGLNSMTGGRIKLLKEIIGNNTFMMTYGDGVSNVNLKKLGNLVKYFKEKSKIDEGWINGGFFVIEPEFMNFIKNENTYLEREPLEIASSKKELYAYKHNDFWQCMDTKRDKDVLEKILKKFK